MNKAKKPMLGARAINFAVLVVIVAAVLAFVMVWKMHRQRDSARELARMASADPRADLDDAIARNDLRFIGVELDEGVIVPGVENYHQQWADRYKLRIIAGDEGFKDLPEARRAERRRAYKYIVAYNRGLLEHIQQRERSTSPPI